jgi:hypothetical protein
MSCCCLVRCCCCCFAAAAAAATPSSLQPHTQLTLALVDHARADAVMYSVQPHAVLCRPQQKQRASTLMVAPAHRLRTQPLIAGQLRAPRRAPRRATAPHSPILPRASACGVLPVLAAAARGRAGSARRAPRRATAPPRLSPVLPASAFGKRVARACCNCSRGSRLCAASAATSYSSSSPVLPVRRHSALEQALAAHLLALPVGLLYVYVAASFRTPAPAARSGRRVVLAARGAVVVAEVL